MLIALWSLWRRNIWKIDVEKENETTLVQSNELDQGGKKWSVLNLIVPNTFTWILTQDSQVVDIQSQLVKKASCIYRIVSSENLVADEMTKTWVTELHKKYALNRTGFSDVQEVLR